MHNSHSELFAFLKTCGKHLLPNCSGQIISEKAKFIPAAPVAPAQYLRTYLEISSIASAHLSVSCAEEVEGFLNLPAVVLAVQSRI